MQPQKSQILSPKNAAEKREDGDFFYYASFKP